jgi:hypothetical protein
LKRIESPPKTDNQFYPNDKKTIVWRLLEMKLGENNEDTPNTLIRLFTQNTIQGIEYPRQEPC